MNCKCKPPIRPLNLSVPVCEQYAGLLSGPELGAVSSRAMQLMNERQTFGLHDAARIWSEALLTLLLAKGMLRPLEIVKTELEVEDETT